MDEYIKNHSVKLQKDKLRLSNKLQGEDLLYSNDNKLKGDDDKPNDDWQNNDQHNSDKIQSIHSEPIYVNILNSKRDSNQEENISDSNSNEIIESDENLITTKLSPKSSLMKNLVNSRGKNNNATKIINSKEIEVNELYKNIIGCSKEISYSGDLATQRNIKEYSLKFEIGMSKENIQLPLKSYSKNNNGAISKPDKNSLNKIAATSCTFSPTEYNNNISMHMGGNKNSPGNENGKKFSRNKTKDDMEQWITDTFYSYFPSLNGEADKKRHQKQIEYQDYVKQLSNEAAKQKQNNKYNITNENSKPFTSRSDKDEMQIIVTNPTYQRDSFGLTNARPGSNRHKLLEDLRHTDISKMMYDDGIQDRNKENLENEAKKKKQYQTELMRQIEEKRRNIEMLKEKEKIEEEILTRKLEDQFQTIKLEEELEKQKIETERTRFEFEQNKIMRQRLLSKLENDQKYLKSNRSTKSENDKNDDDVDDDDTTSIKDKNQVYKFFTNSARREREIRSQSDFQDDILEKFTNNIPNSSNICQHYNKILCPFCDIKLKNYNSWCKKCQRQIFDDGAENRSMLCENCERDFKICASCDKNKNYCKHCSRKRNICLNCIKNFCIHCGHSYCRKIDNDDSGPDSERSFQILDDDDYASNYESPIKSKNNKSYSLNLNKNSIFQPNIPIPEQKYELNIKNGDIIVNRLYDENNLDKSRGITNDKMKKYKSNYKDLIELKKKKINQKSSIDDMPLLGEVHNIKIKHRIYQKTESALGSNIDNLNNNIENLNRKWEVPAVEKRTAAQSSKNSPIVLTQLGAVRRQLQMDRLHLDNAL